MSMNWYPIIWRGVSLARAQASITGWRIFNQIFLSLHPSVSLAPGLEITGLVVWKIAPHRRRRTKPSFNDGRWLRRYRKRWKIERLLAWLHNFRRLVVRWEYHAENYLAFLQLGCATILLRYL